MAAASMSPRGATGVVRPFLTTSVQSRDSHRWVTLVGVVAVATAAGMAIFGLPPVDLHGPLHWNGIMDPFCGGTRAAFYTARGQVGRAWEYNPLGILVVVLGVAVLLRSVIGLVSSRWLTIGIVWTAHRRCLTFLVVVVLLTALEVRQQMRVDLLTAGTWTL